MKCYFFYFIRWWHWAWPRTLSAIWQTATNSSAVLNRKWLRHDRILRAHSRVWRLWPVQTTTAHYIHHRWVVTALNCFFSIRKYIFIHLFFSLMPIFFFSWMKWNSAALTWINLTLAFSLCFVCGVKRDLFHIPRRARQRQGNSDG